MIIEIIGITATIFVIISMCFKTTTKKGSILMRSINLVGSFVFIIYGILLPAYSTAILNAFLCVVNAYHLIILVRK